jgi:hypothetical protein
VWIRIRPLLLRVNRPVVEWAEAPAVREVLLADKAETARAAAE